ncbi:putative ribonuclease H-like domain-containing protein [Tanacetum coccineum]
MDLEIAQTNTTAKLPLLKQEYDMWKLRIEQYFQVQDYALWDVIENENSFKPAAQTTTNADGSSTTLIPGPVTTDEKTQKKNDVKAKALEDCKNKPNLDTMSFDDLYNNFKIVEQEVKGTASSSLSLSSQHLAFMSSTSSTNEVNTAYGVSTSNTQASTGSTQENQDNKSRNQDSSRRTINVEETSSKAMLAIDGAGFDWSFMADEEVPSDMALMAFSDSETLKHLNRGYVTFRVEPKEEENYCVDMKNIVPKESLTCLVAKATLDESMLWHRRLGHVNFKTINKLVKDNLVRGFPSKRFENDQLVSCLKGKQHKASYGLLFDSSSNNANNDEPQPSNDAGKKDDEGRIDNQERPEKITTAPTETTHVDYFEDETEVDMSNISTTYPVPSTPNTRIHKDHSLDNVIGDVQSSEEPKRIAKALSNSAWVEAMQEELLQFKLQKGYTQEEGIDYDKVFAPVARIEAIRMFLAYASFMIKRCQAQLSTPMNTEKPLLKDSNGDDVDVNIYRYLKGEPKLGLWYLRDSPFDLVAYFDSDYVGASLDKKSKTGGCQFLGCRLISWQCKKQTVVATSSTEAEYVAAASCCGQVL